ncbi:myeloid cell surface antigen CD33-like [Amia ocellicauda]|uniref:myeloid cell surface antigen CD33-like n=1 Tax=Amia ocellicauda TaxID=2972642 RepID=UPI003464262A
MGKLFEFLFAPRATGAWLKKSCEHIVSCTQQMRCCYKDRCHFLRRMPAVVFILIFCVTGTQSETTGWPINLPQKLTAEEGLCVIIPCNFSNPENKLQPPFTGIWLKTEQTPPKSVFHSSGPSKVSEEYRGRVALLGNLTENQCTVIISDLRKSDGGTYQFRVEANGQNYTYKKKVHIIINDSQRKPSVSHSPETVNEGEALTLTCNFYCNPPSTVFWIKAGRAQSIINKEKVTELKHTINVTHTDAANNTVNASIMVSVHYHWLLLLTHPNTIIGFISGVSAAAFVVFIWCCIAGICKRRKKPKLKQEPADQKLHHTLEMVTSIQQVQQDEQTPLQEDKPVAGEEPLEVNAGEEKDMPYASIDFARLPGKSSPAETEAEVGGTDYAEVKLKDKNRHEDNTEEQEQDEEYNGTDPTEVDSCVYSQIKAIKK